MFGDNKQIRDVAEVARKIMMGEKLHPNQQKLDVHEPEKDELTADDFKKLRAGKKPDVKKEEVGIEEASHQSKTTMKHIPNPTPAQKQAAKDIKPGVGGYRDRIDMLKSAGVKEEVEELDEVSLKTATSAYVKRMGKDDDKSPVKAVKTMDHIAKKHGVVGVARAAKAADKEYGLNDPVHNKRKDFVKGVMAGVKEEVEEIDEATMTHITLGAKVKDKEGGYNQDVHHKGKKIGHIEAYKHRTGMRYGSHHDASGDSTAGNRDAEESIADIRFAHADHLKSMKKEQVEQMDEVKMADLPSTKVQGRSYGSSKPQPSAFDVLKGPKEKELKSIESEKKKKKMSEMVALYKDGGMKAFFESIKKEDLISEEPDSEQFAKELEDQKKRAAGTKPQADVAKAAVLSVKQEATEQDIQVINADAANGVDQVNIEERTLTAAETDKKEEIVKSMKKGLAGFKERYGKDAKSVIYATATKQAKKD